MTRSFIEHWTWDLPHSKPALYHYWGGGPWLGIEPGTSRTRSQHSTTRLSRWFKCKSASYAMYTYLDAVSLSASRSMLSWCSDVLGIPTLLVSLRNPRSLSPYTLLLPLATMCTWHIYHTVSHKNNPYLLWQSKECSVFAVTIKRMFCICCDNQKNVLYLL